MAAQNLLVLLLVAILALVCIDPAFAAKKKKSKADLEVEKVLTPVAEQLTPLYQKAQARGLFSPDDMAKALDVKLQLLDLIHEYPTSQLLVKPAYEAGRLFRAREMYDDAYDFFNFIQVNFATSPYATQSRVEIQRMKQTLGDQYFADDSPAAVPAAPVGQ